MSEKKPVKKRIDRLMVERGLAGDARKAAALLMAGEVTVNGRKLTKAGALVAADAEIKLAEPPPFVGRGGLKLEHALDSFKIDVSGAAALDIGASTGGFTDCLLQRGARRVYAVDVGYGQLDYSLRRDERVVVMDRTNARNPLDLPEVADLAVIDVSFISAQKIIPAVAAALKKDGNIVVLVKPQFEAEKEEVPPGGVISDPKTHAQVLGRFTRWAVENKFRIKGLVASPVTGASGNREFLVWLRQD